METMSSAVPVRTHRRIFGIIFTGWHWFCAAVVTNCGDGEVRLSRGLNDNEGIIELCINGAYGALWEELFTLEIAKVTCRELFGRAEGQVENSRILLCLLRLEYLKL